MLLGGELSPTDEQIRAATVGQLTPHNAPITLVPSDPAWPALFEREHERITKALEERVLLLEHVGSTSVSGLAARPIIRHGPGRCRLLGRARVRPRPGGCRVRAPDLRALSPFASTD